MAAFDATGGPQCPVEGWLQRILSTWMKPTYAPAKTCRSPHLQLHPLWKLLPQMVVQAPSKKGRMAWAAPKNLAGPLLLLPFRRGCF